MFTSKRLNGTSNVSPALVAGEGISIVSNQIHVDDSYVATDTQLTEATSILVTRAQLTESTSEFVTQADITTAITPLATRAHVSEAISTFVTQADITTAVTPLATKVHVSEAISTFVTQADINTATSAATTNLASVVAENEFTEKCSFVVNTIFKNLLIVYPDADVTKPGVDGGIYVFRELELLRSMWTTPTWVNVELVPAHFTAGTYYATPQYTKFQYGAASMVKLRGEMQERDDYLNSSDTRRLFTLPLGYRPANRHLFVCAGGNGRIAATVLVNHNGDVLYLAQSSVVEHDSVNTLWLDSISFFTN